MANVRNVQVEEHGRQTATLAETTLQIHTPGCDPLMTESTESLVYIVRSMSRNFPKIPIEANFFKLKFFFPPKLGVSITIAHDGLQVELTTTVCLHAEMSSG